MPDTKKTDPLVLVGRQNGVTVIPADTPLTRLNYFDGKFLRAADLQAEQRYLRRLVALSNEAGGPGVAHGFDVSLGGGDTLQIGPGLALDPAGRVLLLPQETSVGLQELIDKSNELTSPLSAATVKRNGTFEECEVAAAAPPGNVPRASDLYLITIAYAEALCGQEDVFGKLCEEACVTSTDRPYLVEGLVVRALPLVLRTPLATSTAVALDRTHLRSRVASAYFADERDRVASLISGAGLRSPVWCFGAEGASGQDVPLAVVARAGSSTVFLDAWTARRERIDTPARRYWQWRLAMRPWDVFLAQVLQFQCQLHDLFRTAPEPGGSDGDPCREVRRLVAEASDTLAEVTRFYEAVTSRLARLPAAGDMPAESLTLKGGLSQLTDLQKKLLGAKQGSFLGPLDRVLIRGGIVELPSAGYLPVTPGSAVTVNQQVRQLLGEGVDLRFCVVRPDFVAHALEEAQHLERISLLEGLDHPDNLPQVDVLVPNGELLHPETRTAGTGFEAEVAFVPSVLAGETSISTVVVRPSVVRVHGAARTEVLDTGGAALYLAGVTEAPKPAVIVDLVQGLAGVGRSGDSTHLEILRRLAQQPGETPGPGAGPPWVKNPGLFTRLNTLAAEALRFNTARRADLLWIAEPTAVAPGTFVPSAGPDAAPVVALWMSMSSGRNVFALGAQDTTPVDLRLVLVLPAKEPTSLDLQLRGEFRVGQPAPPSGADRAVKGRLSALASLQRVEAGKPKPPEATSLNLDAAVKLSSPTGQPPSVEILLWVDKDVVLRFVTSWDSGPLRIKALLQYQKGKETIGLGEASLKENPDVLVAGNATHTVALSALEVIGAALGDSTFADLAGRLLFPPPLPPAEELLVRGTLDWVLFHRRRIKQCGAAKQLPPPAPPRRYQVYHLLVPSDKTVADVQDALLKNDAARLTRFGFGPVDRVEFGAGVPALVSRPEDVLADWQAVQPGNTLVYGAIASQGSAVDDGTALALGRLARLEQALASVSALGPQAVAEVLAAVPTPLAVPGVDGVIALLTLRVVEKTCQTVYRVLNAQDFNEVVKLAESGALQQVIDRKLVSVLGDVSFEAGTTKADDASLQSVVSAWKNAGGGVPERATVLSRSGDPPATVKIRGEQGQVIEKALGGAAGVEVREVTATLPTKCPAVLFVAAKKEEGRMGRIFVQTDSSGSRRILIEDPPPLTVSFNPDGSLPAGALNAILDPIKQRAPHFLVELATEEVPADALAVKRLDAVFQALRTAGVLGQNARQKPAVLQADEKRLLNLRGVQVKDVIFVSKVSE
jgi:hypothetical protein